MSNIHEAKKTLDKIKTRIGNRQTAVIRKEEYVIITQAFDDLISSQAVDGDVDILDEFLRTNHFTRNVYRHCHSYTLEKKNWQITVIPEELTIEVMDTVADEGDEYQFTHERALINYLNYINAFMERNT